jgi:hypothetical protein
MACVHDEHAPRSPLVVVVGSGLSYDREKKTGVADVSTIVGWLREQGIPLPEGVPAKLYQDGMHALKNKKTAWAVAAIIRRAILEAHRLTEKNRKLRKVAEGDPSDDLKNACLELEKHSEDWVLPDGVTGLARWLASIVRARRNNPNEKTGPIHVVTTNFDPLIEVALSTIGDIKITSLSIPGNTPQEPTSCDVCIWHVHGAWWDVTLHEEQALQQHRQLVAQKLAERMKYAQICVLGYGGWQDVVSTTIADILGTSGGQPSISWAFFEPDEKDILDKYREPLERLRSAPAFSQTTLFRGVDLHRELLELLRDVESQPPPPPSFPGADIPEELLNRLQSRIGELLDAAPAAARPDVQKLLTLGGKLPDLCVVLRDLCLVLRPMSHGKERRRFARAVLDASSTLGECILVTAPEFRSQEQTADAPITMETALMGEFWMAAQQHRSWRLASSETGVAPVDGLYDCAKRGLLEVGPDIEDWILAFEKLLWDEFFPHIDYNPEKHRLTLKGELQTQKDFDAQAFALVEEWQPWRSIEQRVPEVRFFLRAMPGTTSPPLDQYRLAALLRRLLTLAPELSTDVTVTKESPL